MEVVLDAVVIVVVVVRAVMVVVVVSVMAILVVVVAAIAIVVVVVLVVIVIRVAVVDVVSVVALDVVVVVDVVAIDVVRVVVVLNPGRKVISVNVTSSNPDATIVKFDITFGENVVTTKMYRCKGCRVGGASRNWRLDKESSSCTNKFSKGFETLKTWE